MSTKASVKTQAKTPVAPAAAHIPRPPVAELEHEAERPAIAAQLEGAARLGHSFGALGVDLPAPPLIQRQEMPEEEEEELQLKREPAAVQRPEVLEEEGEVMLKPEEGRVGPQGGQVPTAVEAAINRARGGGQPLEGVLQEQMGASLGHDFSGVRVHADSEADALNQQLCAKAFTIAPDIFFKRGAYEPCATSGRELIAHEMFHVVQQSEGRVRGMGSSMTVRPAGDTFEQEAEALEYRTGCGGRSAPLSDGSLAEPPMVGLTALPPAKRKMAIPTQGTVQRDCALSDRAWHTASCHQAVGAWLVDNGYLTENQARQDREAYEEYYWEGAEPVANAEEAGALPEDQVESYWSTDEHLQHSVRTRGGRARQGFNNVYTFGVGPGEFDVPVGVPDEAGVNNPGWREGGEFRSVTNEQLEVWVISPDQIRQNAGAEGD